MTKIVHHRADAATPRSSAQDWGLYGARGQRKYLNGDERRRFIAASMREAPKVRTLCLTPSFIGCRLSEALNLTAGDIEIASGLISVRSLKKRGRLVVRQIPAPAALLDEIGRVHGLASAEARLWSWGRTRAWQLVKTVMATARVEQLPASPKGLRHGFGVHAILSGVPLNLVQRWLGHEDIATTAIYANVIGPEEQAIAARIWVQSPRGARGLAGAARRGLGPPVSIEMLGSGWT